MITHSTTQTQFLLFPFRGLGKLRGIFRTAVHEDVAWREEEEAEAAPESTSSTSSSFLFTAVLVTTQPRALKWSITLPITNYNGNKVTAALTIR